MNLPGNQHLIEALRNPRVYPHATESVQLTETHCAWVLLTGEYAYKIKKPVDFGFLDFSTLEKRRFFCEEEVRLNRRFAPEVYLDVVAITGKPDDPHISGTGPVLEYAVRMRQFPADGLLSLVAERQRLETWHIDQMIERVAEFHQSTDRAAPDSPFGEAGRIHHWVIENFEHIRDAVDTPQRREKLERIRQWADDERERLDEIFKQRKQDGFIRECHGDLHLGNLTLIDGNVTLFDCIEFNAELRWIDVISEVAFLVMDLEDRGYPELAHRFLNGYLQQTGDYAGLAVLRYYLVYRAMVRAKVAMLRREQAAPDSEAFRTAQAEYAQYVELADGYTKPEPPALLITHGLSGSGKSTVAVKLCQMRGMIQIRSDVERKRMAGLAATADSRSGIDQGLYASDRTAQTYRRLLQLAALVLEAGFPVILDATFLQQAYRRRASGLAARHRVPFVILDCVAPEQELRRRIRERAKRGGDASEANLQVLDAQQKAEQPLSGDELDSAVKVDTSEPDWLAETLEGLQQHSGSRVSG
jgi:aminoglycoside phosphotransferase family enzyme/adenylate kinase family enzyme